MNQVQSKATIVRVFKHGDVELRLTEKNAVTAYQNTDRGVQFRFSCRPSDVELHALLGSTAFQEIIESPEWTANGENKEKNKARDYAIQQMNKAVSRRELEIKAATEQLQRLGIDPASVLKSTPKAS